MGLAAGCFPAVSGADRGLRRVQVDQIFVNELLSLG